MEKENTTHVCIVCGYTHSDEDGTKWEDLPEDYSCPECGCGKEDYVEA